LRFGIRHFADTEVVAVAGSVLVLNQNNTITGFQAVEYLTGLNFFKSAQSYLGLVTIIPGPSGLFKKSELQKIGGYEADTFAEDCDLTLRLVQSGARVVYEPYMEVSTEVPDKTLTLIKQRYRWNRGILQATRKFMRMNSIFRVRDVKTLMVFGYLWLESIALPVLNVFIAVLSLVYQLVNADFSLLSLWLVVLLGLDMAVVLITLVDNAAVFASKGEMRKLVQGGGVSLNKEKLAAFDQVITTADLLDEKYLLVQRGKKNYYLIIAK
jgi:cellulose synthase/poly-beta-1,6-N-acetylglucosamine synthase-like glycosyltransferase